MSEAESPHTQENFHDPQDPWSVHEYEVVNENPDVISYQLDGERSEQGGNSSYRPEAANGTPPKKLKDFLESTEELNQALDDAVEIMKEQETQAAQVPEAPKMAQLMLDITPNKVTYMDYPDTKIANPGRHRNKAEFIKAKMNQVAILEAPGSPDKGKTNKDPDSPQSGIVPLTPKVTKAGDQEKCQKQGEPL